MTLDEWYELAANDADRRHLPDLKPVLKGLHGAAAALRAAAWNDDARGEAAASVPASPASGAASASATPSSAETTPDVTPSQPSPRASS
jgi:hypothetical protein